MKIIIPFFSACILFACASVSAQQTNPSVKFSNGDFNAGNNIVNKTFNKAAIRQSLFGNHYYVLLQFKQIPSLALQQKLKDAGITTEQYLPGNAYYATVDSNFDFTRAASLDIQSVNIVPEFYKVHKAVYTYQEPTDKNKQQALAITVSTTGKTKAAAELIKNGAIIITRKWDASGLILVQYNKNIISRIASLPFVYSIGMQLLHDQPLNYNSRAASGSGGLNSSSGKNLNGSGVTIGVGDDADISSHIDFAGRLINRTPWVRNNHGTHTSGTAAGAGIINVKNRGMAAKATIVSQFFSDIVVNAPTYISDYGMVVTNNSYHSAEDACAGEGEYNTLSNYADNQLFNNNQLQHVFASGNDGALTCFPYPSSFATVKSGWQCSKNILTVGALDVSNNTIASYSSRGPVKDGRIKPEITADGFAVLSTNANNTYGVNYGTSMACPAVTGSMALMYEEYRKRNGGANPKSALMKAIICNTAEDLGNPGPDYTYGFGMLNTRRAVDVIDSSRYFQSTIAFGGSNTHNFTIPSGVRKLKVMLYWHDKPAASNVASSLVNDLDMVVITPGFGLHRPLILNNNPSSVNDNATEGPDHINNIEQVVIDNPPAGIYSANINGYSIAAGTQDYVVTYEIVKNGITVQHPTGGETLVPGETESIRWNAYGSENNTFTIEYSINNGSSWTTIDNNVPANTRVYQWTVPSSVTNNALIRISRNSSPYSDLSDAVFTILGQPSVTAANVCEGAVQLSWSGITGATSYDVLQLSGDSMQVIGNTTATSYLVTGLNKNGIYWMGVAAKNNSSPGRRSISVQVFPNSGPCTLSNFNNDIKVDSILEPTTARQFFSNAANATKPVKVLIKNLGATAVTGPYNVSFNYGAATVTETANTTINPGGSVIYTFTGTYPVITSGYQYNFKAWVTKSSDNNHVNDTAYKTVKYINNDAINTLPVSENFESMPASTFVSAELAIGGNKYLDFSSNSDRGRARTFVNTGLTFAGSRALTLDQAPYSVSPNADSAVFNYNLSLWNGKQLRFDFYYKNHGQADAGGNKVWIRGSENNNWVQAFDLFAGQGALGEWKKAIVNVNEVLSNAVPAQTFSPTFQIKIGQEGYTSANNPEPVIDIDDGYTFDNLLLSEAVNDISIQAINSPASTGCGLTATTPVNIRIKNHHSSSLNNIQVNYRINNGSVISETIASLGSGQTLDYTFSQTADFSAYTDYVIDAWVKYTGDTYSSNDSINGYQLHNSPVITSFPYLESFETGNGNFYTKGTSSTWQWGTPAKTFMYKAPNGTKAWATNLIGNYSDNETSYLYTPCFNLAAGRRWVLAFSHLYEVEQGYDYTWVEYSTDGKTWNKLGNINEGTNWYDDAATNSWNNSNVSWHAASIDLPFINTNTTFKFRFVMSSDGGVTKEGIGIDDVRVFEKMEIAGSPLPLFPGESSGPWNNNWNALTYGDALMGPYYVTGEVNSRGQNLGTVTITPYVNYNNPVRSSNYTYYLDKSFVVSSTIRPSNRIGLRLYFSDLQYKTFVAAGDCGTCTKPADPYGFGILNYDGTAAEEDGTLDNNGDGFYTFITPDSTLIMPHNDGYYAEFNTNTFGEFWFAHEPPYPAAADQCANTPIVLNATTGNTYQWQVNTGSGYTNISDGLNYSGTASQSLTISSLPTSATGNLYRCVTDGAPGIVYTLRFRNFWTGNNGTSWFDTGNWSCGTIPDQYTDVTIPGGLTNYPVLTANAAVRSLRVLATVPFTVNPGVVLEVKGKSVN